MEVQGDEPEERDEASGTRVEEPGEQGVSPTAHDEDEAEHAVERVVTGPSPLGEGNNELDAGDVPKVEVVRVEPDCVVLLPFPLAAAAFALSLSFLRTIAFCAEDSGTTLAPPSDRRRVAHVLLASR